MSALSLFTPSNRRRCVKGRSSYTEPSDNLISSLAVNNDFSNDNFNENDYSSVQSAEPEDLDEEPITIDLSAFLSENPLLAQSAFESSAENNIASTESSSQFRVTDCEIKPSELNSAEVSKTEISDVSSTINISDNSVIENCAPSAFLDSTLISNAKSITKQNSPTNQSNFSTLTCNSNDNIKENCLNNLANVHSLAVLNEPVKDIIVNGKKSPVKKFSRAKLLGLSNPLKKYKNFMKIKDLNKTSMKVFGKYPIVKCEKLDIEDFVKNNNIKVSNWPLHQTVKNQKNKSLLNKNSIANRKISLTKAAMKPKVRKPISFNRYKLNSNDESASKLSSILIDSCDAMDTMVNPLVIKTDSWKPEITTTSTSLPKFFRSPAKKPSIIPKSFISNVLNHDAFRDNMNQTFNYSTLSPSRTLVKKRNGPIITSVNKVTNAPTVFKFIAPKPVVQSQEITNVLPSSSKPATETVADPVSNDYTVIEPYVDDPASPLKPKPILTVPVEVVPSPERPDLLLSDGTVNENSENVENSKTVKSAFLNGAIRQISTPSRPKKAISVTKKSVAVRKKFNKKSVLNKNIEIPVAVNKAHEESKECPSVLKAKNAVVDAMQSVFSSMNKTTKAKPKVAKKEPDLSAATDVNCSYSSTLNDLFFGFSENDFEDTLFNTEEKSNTQSNIASISDDDFITPYDVASNVENGYMENIKDAKLTGIVKTKRNKGKIFLSDSNASDTQSASECEKESKNVKTQKSPKKKSGKLTSSPIGVSETVDVTSIPDIPVEPDMPEDVSVSTYHTESSDFPENNKSFDNKNSSCSFTSFENSDDEIKSTLNPLKEKQSEIANLDLNETPTRNKNKKIFKRNSNPVTPETSTRTLRGRKCSSTEVDKSDNSVTLGIKGKSSKLVKSSINSKLKIQMKTPPKSTAKVKIKQKSSKPEDIIQEINTITGGRQRVKTVLGVKKDKKESDSEKDLKNSDISSSKDESESNSTVLVKPSRVFSKKKKTLKVCIKRSNRKNRASALKKKLNSLTDAVENSNSTSSVTENNESLHSSFRKGKADKMETTCKEESIPENVTPVSELSMEVIETGEMDAGEAHVMSDVQDESLVNSSKTSISNENVNVMHSNLSNFVSDSSLCKENQNINLTTDAFDKSAEDSETKDINLIPNTNSESKDLSVAPNIDEENQVDVLSEIAIDVPETNTESSNTQSDEMLESNDVTSDTNLEIPAVDHTDSEKYIDDTEIRKYTEIDSTSFSEDDLHKIDSLVNENYDKSETSKTENDNNEININSGISGEINVLTQAAESETTDIVNSNECGKVNVLTEEGNCEIVSSVDIEGTNVQTGDGNDEIVSLVDSEGTSITTEEGNCEIVSSVNTEGTNVLTENGNCEIVSSVNIEGTNVLAENGNCDVLSVNPEEANTLTEEGNCEIVASSEFVGTNVSTEEGNCENVSSVNSEGITALIEEDNCENVSSVDSEGTNVLVEQDDYENSTSAIDKNENTIMKQQENVDERSITPTDKDTVSNVVESADNSFAVDSITDKTMIIIGSTEDASKSPSNDADHACSLNENFEDNVSSKLISDTSDLEQNLKIPEKMAVIDDIAQSNSSEKKKKCPKLKISFKKSNENSSDSLKNWYVSENRLSDEESHVQPEVPETNSSEPEGNSVEKVSSDSELKTDSNCTVNVIESDSIDTRLKDAVATYKVDETAVRVSVTNDNPSDIDTSSKDALVVVKIENTDDDDDTLDYDEKMETGENKFPVPSIESVKSESGVKSTRKSHGKLHISFSGGSKSSGIKLEEPDEPVDEKPIILGSPKSKAKKKRSSSAATPQSARKKNYVLELVVMPFSSGWMREHVIRATSGSDIYYFGPDGGKLRSMPEIISYLSKHPEIKLTRENFTFAKELIYREPFEIERDAKVPSTRPSIPTPNKKTPSSTPGSKKKNPIQKTVSPVSVSPPKKKIHKKSSPLKRTSSCLSLKTDEHLNNSNSNRSKQKTIDQYLGNSGKKPARPNRKIVKKVPFDNSDDTTLPRKPKLDTTLPKKPKLTPNRKSESDKLSKSVIDVDQNKLSLNESFSTSIIGNTSNVSPAQTNKSVLIQKRLKVKLAPRKIDLEVLQKPCTKFCNFAFCRFPTIKCKICLCLFHPECIPFKPSNDKVYACGPCVANHINSFKDDDDPEMPIPNVENELLYPTSSLQVTLDPNFLTAFNKFYSPTDTSFQQSYTNVNSQQTYCNTTKNIVYQPISPAAACSFGRGKTNTHQYLNKQNILYHPSPGDGSVPLKQLRTFVAASNLGARSNIPSQCHANPTFSIPPNYRFPYANDSSYKILIRPAPIQIRTVVPLRMKKDIPGVATISSGDRMQLSDTEIVKDTLSSKTISPNEISVNTNLADICSDKSNQSFQSTDSTVSVLQTLLQNKSADDYNSSNLEINSASTSGILDCSKKIKLDDCLSGKYENAVGSSPVLTVTNLKPYSNPALHKNFNSVLSNQNVCSPCTPWPYFSNMPSTSNLPENLSISQNSEAVSVKNVPYSGMYPFSHVLLLNKPTNIMNPQTISPTAVVDDTPKDLTGDSVKRKTNPPGYLRDYSRGTQAKKLKVASSINVDDSSQFSDSTNDSVKQSSDCSERISSVIQPLKIDDSSQVVNSLETDGKENGVCLGQQPSVYNLVRSEDSQNTADTVEGQDHVNQNHDDLQQSSSVNHSVKTNDLSQAADTFEICETQSRDFSLLPPSVGYMVNTDDPSEAVDALKDMKQHSQDLSQQQASIHHSVNIDSETVDVPEDSVKQSGDCSQEHSPVHLRVETGLPPDSQKVAEIDNIKQNPDCPQQLSSVSGKNSYSETSKVLSIVFKRLRVFDLLMASQVCQEWKHVATQKYLWKNVSFSGLIITNWNKCCRFLQECGTKSIDMRGIQNKQSLEWWKRFSENINCLVSVEELFFETVPPFIVKDITDNLPLLKNLACYCVTTVFTEPGLWTTPCQLEMSPLRFLGRLQRLKISCMGGIYLDNTRKSLMPYLPNLTHVVLTGFKFHDYMNLECLSQQKQLIGLELGDCVDIEPQIYGLISKLTNLENLCLQNGGNVNDMKMPEAVSKMNRLVHLELMNYKVSIYLADVLEKLEYLCNFGICPDNSSEASLVNYNSFRAVIACKNLKNIEWGVLVENELSIPELLEMKDPNKDEVDKFTYEEFFETLVQYFPGRNILIESYSRSAWSEFCCSRNFL